MANLETFIMHSDSGLSIETFFVLLIMALDYGESCLREDDSPLPQAIKVVGPIDISYSTAISITTGTNAIHMMMLHC